VFEQDFFLSPGMTKDDVWKNAAANEFIMKLESAGVDQSHFVTTIDQAELVFFCLLRSFSKYSSVRVSREKDILLA
jgi:hypothetical protein